MVTSLRQYASTLAAAVLRITAKSAVAIAASTFTVVLLISLSIIVILLMFTHSRKA